MLRRSTPSRGTRSHSSRSARDRGAVATLLAVAAVPVLVSMCAIGVDLSRLHAEGERLQQAVDAAALAGAVLLPTNPAGARSQATDVLRRNVREAALDRAEASSQRPTRIAVQAHLRVPTTFGSILGPGAFTIRRSAEADYAAELLMASACNVLGNEAMSPVGGGAGQDSVGTRACAGQSGQYWLNISGEFTNKSRGDAFASRWCTVPDAPPVIDGCDPPSGRISPPGENTEYRPGGYDVVVRTPASGSLQIQGYDLGFVPAGDECAGFVVPDGTRRDPLAGAQTILANEYVAQPGATNPRYAPGNSPYCTGDGHVGAGQGATAAPARNMTTTVVVRGPLTVPSEPTSGPQLCSLVIPGVDGYTERMATLLRPGAGGARGAMIRRTFHRWADICPARLTAVAGEYAVSVRTTSGGGQNRFALRANLTGEGSAGLTVSPLRRVSLFANVPAGTSRWPMVRLDSSAAGRTVGLRLFDVGDAAKAVTVTVDDDERRAAWSSCRLSGSLNGSKSPCSFSAVATTTGGRWLRIDMDVPRSYRCAADADPTRCWLSVRMSSPSTQHDTTTWVAEVLGDPVRLVAR